MTSDLLPQKRWEGWSGTASDVVEEAKAVLTAHGFRCDGNAQRNFVNYVAKGCITCAAGKAGYGARQILEAIAVWILRQQKWSLKQIAGFTRSASEGQLTDFVRDRIQGPQIAASPVQICELVAYETAGGTRTIDAALAPTEYLFDSQYKLGETMRSVSATGGGSESRYKLGRQATAMSWISTWGSSDYKRGKRCAPDLKVTEATLGQSWVLNVSIRTLGSDRRFYILAIADGLKVRSATVHAGKPGAREICRALDALVKNIGLPRRITSERVEFGGADLRRWAMDMNIEWQYRSPWAPPDRGLMLIEMFLGLRQIRMRQFTLPQVEAVLAAQLPWPRVDISEQIWRRYVCQHD